MLFSAFTSFCFCFCAPAFSVCHISRCPNPLLYMRVRVRVCLHKHLLSVLAIGILYKYIHTHICTHYLWHTHAGFINHLLKFSFIKRPSFIVILDCQS